MDMTKDAKYHQSITRHTCFLTLVNQASDLISIVDRKGNFRFLNNRHAALLGDHFSELVGRNVFDRIHAADQAGFIVSFSSLRHKRQVKFSPFRLKDTFGNWRWISTNATDLSKDPTINGIVLVAQDMTDLVSKTDQLRRIEERDNLLMSTTGEALFDWDIFEDTLMWTSSFLIDFGYDTTQCNSYDFFNRIYPEDQKRVWGEIEDGMRAVETSTIFSEFRFFKSDGGLVRVDYLIIFLRDQQGKVYRAVGSLRNISEYDNHLEKVKRKNAMIREVAFSESHVVRAPLSRMLEVIDLILNNPHVQSECKELLLLVSQLANEFDRNIREISK
jgi:PAS domain S-box-containing protein